MPDSAWPSHQYMPRDHRSSWRPAQWVCRLSLLMAVFAILPGRTRVLAILGGLLLLPAVRSSAVLLAQGWVRRLRPPDPDGR